MKNKIEKILFSSINPITLGVFRIAFGFFAFLEIIYFYQTHLIEDYIIQPKVLFNYSFIPLNPFPEGVLDMIWGITLLSSLFIIAGVFYRISIITFFVGFTYFFLLDKAYYNNHLYLFSLIAFLMIFIPADNALSLNKKKTSTPTLSWHLRILQFQFVVVYFFGGIAKINTDWLMHLEPIKSTLLSNGINSNEAAFFFAYTGLLFDLFIGFLLLIRKTRLVAMFFVLAFNIMNHFLFDDINIFPFFMMASLVVFFDLGKWPFFSKYITLDKESILFTKSKNLILIGLSIYVLIQLIMPLRHFLIPGNVDWTGEGQRFSWRMKIQQRSIKMCEFAIFDLDKKKIYPVNINLHIHEVQKQQMIHYPKMVLDFAHYLKEYAREEHQLTNIMVKARINVGFNQRELVEMVSQEIDLTKEEWNSFGHNEWINPL